MESRKINEQKEQVIIKKGLFYYIFKLIALPFILIYKILRFIFPIVSNSLKWCGNEIKEYTNYRQKKAKLIKLLYPKNKIQEEII